MAHNASGACWVFFVDNLCVTPAPLWLSRDNSLTLGLKMVDRLLMGSCWPRKRDHALFLEIFRLRLLRALTDHATC